MGVRITISDFHLTECHEIVMLRGSLRCPGKPSLNVRVTERTSLIPRENIESQHGATLFTRMAPCSAPSTPVLLY